MPDEIVPVPAHQVPGYWDEAAPIIQRALDHGHGAYHLRDIFDALTKREMQLWLGLADGVVKAALITELCRYPRITTCILRLFAADKAKRWFPHLEVIETWARAQGCVAIEVFGRLGWRKMLDGWTETHAILRKELK